MELSTLRKLVVATIILLLLYQMGSWLATAFNGVVGVVGALAVAGVTFACARLARTNVGNTGWFLVPTLLFTVVPLFARVWLALSESASLIDHAVTLTPVIIGFVMPVLLLLLVYKELGRRTRGT
jgi:hypothetical protein